MFLFIQNLMNIWSYSRFWKMSRCATFVREIGIFTILAETFPKLAPHEHSATNIWLNIQSISRHNLRPFFQILRTLLFQTSYYVTPCFCCRLPSSVEKQHTGPQWPLFSLRTQDSLISNQNPVSLLRMCQVYEVRFKIENCKPMSQRIQSANMWVVSKLVWRDI